MTQIDYLAIGHVAKDLAKDLTAVSYQLGGTVSFSSQVAVALGCRTAVYTSAPSDMALTEALPHVALHCLPSPEATTFTNTYTANGRHQTLHARAHPLTTADLPADWHRATILHLAPIADEVEPALINLFSNSFIGVTPQGWLRQWDADGRVSPKTWAEAQTILPLATAVIMGEDDLYDEAILTQFKQWAKLLVLTQGANGCTLFWGDEIRQFPALSVNGTVETTGAGDIFATAFFIRLYQTAGDAWEAARFANIIAGHSVTQSTLKTKVTAIDNYLKETTG